MERPVRRVSSWSKVADYINSKEISYVFTRQELLHNIKGVRPNTIDTYIRMLDMIGILEKIKTANHKLIVKIPDELDTIILSNLLYEQRRMPWKKWFMPFQDKLNRYLSNYK
jgi:hypothetical protein